jgi:hypothetical protein
MESSMLAQSLTNSLAAAADAAISSVLLKGGARTPRPTGEVTAVRTMTLDGFDEVAARWSPILKSAGYRIDLRAVFCHSRPHVTFAPVPHPKHVGGKSPRRCELADLLIVIDHIDPSQGIDDRRAVLIQAKLITAGAIRPSGSEWVQHELLGWLPTFTFVDASYDKRRRDFACSPLVGSPIHSAEYGGIDLKAQPPVWRHELTQKTAPWFHSQIAFGNYLAEMATGRHGCSREAIRGGLDDWSFTIDELLNVTGARPITQKNSVVVRSNDNVVGFVSDTSPLSGSGEGGRIDFTEGAERDWPEGPMSTVHVTIRSLDDRSEE